MIIYNNIYNIIIWYNICIICVNVSFFSLEIVGKEKHSRDQLKSIVMSIDKQKKKKKRNKRKKKKKHALIIVPRQQPRLFVIRTAAPFAFFVFLWRSVGTRM